MRTAKLQHLAKLCYPAILLSSLCLSRNPLEGLEGKRDKLTDAISRFYDTDFSSRRTPMADELAGILVIILRPTYPAYQQPSAPELVQNLGTYQEGLSVDRGCEDFGHAASDRNTCLGCNLYKDIRQDFCG